MFASRWHSPPKPDSVFSWTTGTCRAAIRSASIEPWTSPSSTPTRTPRAAEARASSSEVLPAPGRAHEVDHRDPGAVEVVAVGAGDRLVGVQRVGGDLHLGAVHCSSSMASTSIDSTSSSAPRTTSAPAASQAGHRNCGSTQAEAAWPAAAPERGPTRARRPRSASRRRPARARARRRRRWCRGRRPRSRSPAIRARPGAGRRPGRRPGSPGARPRGGGRCRRSRSRSRARASHSA